MMIKFPVSRRHIDAKGFLFNTTGPFMSKRDAKGVASKSDAKMVLTKLQYVTSWDETVLIKQHFRCYLFRFSDHHEAHITV